MLIAQITDLHLRQQGALAYDAIDVMANARAAIDTIAALAVKPDMIVLTGDLSDKGEPEAYAWLDAELGRRDIPAYVIPGNHDLRAPMRQAFGHRGYLPQEGYLHYVIEAGSVRVIALDTVIEYETGGRMCAERCSWLADRLAEDRKTPTLIMMHHQPFLTGSSFDAIGVDGREDLEGVIASAPNVELVICGHMHRGLVCNWAQTIVNVCPSTAFQFDLYQADPSTFRVRAEPPAYQLHHWQEETGFVTSTGMLGDFPLLHERASP